MEKDHIHNKNSQDEKDSVAKNADIHKTGDSRWWQPAVLVFFRTSSWIVVPLILSLFFGNWLADRYKTGQWIVFVCIGIAFSVTIGGLIKTYNRELKQFNDKNKKQK